jgi:hypothetical protein
LSFDGHEGLDVNEQAKPEYQGLELARCLFVRPNVRAKLPAEAGTVSPD